MVNDLILMALLVLIVLIGLVLASLSLILRLTELWNAVSMIGVPSSEDELLIYRGEQHDPWGSREKDLRK